jgi:hypothetical protein
MKKMNVRLGYDNGVIFFSFKYDKEIVEIMNSGGDCMFDWGKKYWKVNLASVTGLVKMLEEKNHKVIKNKKFKEMFG